MLLVVVGGRAGYSGITDALDPADFALATSFEEAEDRLGSTDPDALLLSVGLDEDAASFLEGVRAGAHGRAWIPIVAVTDGDAERARSLGADETVEAPLAAGDVEAAVERAALLGRYKTAINEFFDACRRRARGAAVPAHPSAARRHADEILAEIHSTDASIPFDRLVEGD